MDPKKRLKYCLKEIVTFTLINVLSAGVYLNLTSVVLKKIRIALQ